MKKNVAYITFLLVLLTACSSISVNTDYDKKIDFKSYKTYAFYKTGIDKVEISDLDKKRILNSIDEAMTLKGFTKSEKPDLLINFNTKSEKNISVSPYYGGWGFGYGWNSGYYGNASVYSSIEGVLTIDIIDAAKKELIWQGEGVGILTKNVDEKEATIKKFVTKIVAQFPPLEQKK